MGRGRLFAMVVAALAVTASGAGGSAAAVERHAALRPPGATPSVVPGKLIVGFRSGVSERAQRAVLARAGAAAGPDLGSSRVELASIAPSAAGRALSILQGDDRVRYVEPDRIIHLDAPAQAPNDAQFKKEWGLNNTGQVVDFSAGTPGADIGALRAWGVTTGKKSVVVGVIDTGIDATHPDLASNIWINPGENCAGCRSDGIDNDHNGYVDDWRGWDFVNNDNNPFDDNGHGTHVAGTIGAIGNNGTGVAGVNWNVQLMPLKFIGADGTGDVASAVLALRYATAMGARVTNNSWGDDQYSQALADAIAEADAHGDLFVAAAGNESNNNDLSPRYPAGFDLPNVISVAASDSTDHLAYFSNFGRGSVDLAAPGVSIYSTWPGKAYKSLSGTSMASPHVAGAAALVLAAHPTATAATIKALLLRTVDRPAGLSGTSATSGRLDAGNALTCGNAPQVLIDSPGQGFVAAPGHAVSVRILAGVCGNVAGVTVTATGNGQSIALTARGDGTYTGQFTPTVPGTSTITAAAVTAGGATDNGSVSGTSPSPIAIGGAPVTVTSAAGEDVLLAFDGAAGTRLSAQLSNVTIPTSTVTIRSPDGSTLATQTTGTGSAFIDTAALQQPGSYVVTVHPLGTTGGSMTIQLYDVPADASAAISPGGPELTLTTTVPGQNAVASFTGTAGERVALGTSSAISFLKTTIVGPGGAQLAGPLYTGGGSGFIDTLRLPAGGTYTIVSDPQDARTGSIALDLYDVPADATAAIVPGGPAVTLTTTVAAQNAVATFTGLAGHRVALSTSSAISFLKTTIVAPGGTQLAGPLYTGGGRGFIDTLRLPVDGTYTIVSDPQDARTGSVTLTLYDVPDDVTATIQPGGAPATATVTAPGQNALFTFAGTAGRRVSLGVSSDVSLLRTSILNPDGSVLSAPGYSGPGNSFVDTNTLPQTGTYTIVADPQDVRTGSVTVTLYDVPPDPTATATVGGAPVTLATSVPGQNAAVSFAGAAGQPVSVAYSSSGFPSLSVTLLAPNGSPIGYGSSGFIDSVTLPTGGQYTIVVDPAGAAIGSATLQVNGVPVDLTGSLAVGGAPLTLQMGAGQNARITFAGAAGGRLSMAVTGSGLPQTRLDIRAPDGSTLTTFYVASGGGFLDVRTLPATGTYTLVIDPSGGSAVSLTVTAYNVPPDATGATVPGGASAAIPITVPGQNGSVSFPGSAGQRVSFKLAMLLSARIAVQRPDGTTQLSAIAGGDTFLDVTTLPATGTYTMSVDPLDAATGPVSVTVYDVPPDVTGTIVQGGASLTVAMPVPGQGGAISFSAAAGQSLMLNLSSVSVPIMRVSVLRPDGSVLMSPSWVLGSTSFVLTAPVAGGYTIVLDPYTGYTGSATVSLL